MNTVSTKALNHPDETRTLPKTLLEVVHLGDKTIMKATFQPGWKWSECVKPTVDTSSCQIPHLMYIISGRMVIHMNDGYEKEIGPNDAASIPPGHDAWVIGNEPCITLDFSGGHSYGKNNSRKSNDAK